MKKIDVFNHVMPRKLLEKLGEVSGDPEMLKRVGHIPTLWDIEARVRMIEKFADFQQIISLASPPIEVGAGPDLAPELTRLANDEMAEICRNFPDLFPSFIASIPMNNPDAALMEIDHALDELHAAAIQVFTNVDGLPLDDPCFFPIFEHAVHRDVTIFMHPARGAGFSDYRTEKKSRYELWWAFGWPYETTIAMARLVYSGMFDRLPGMRIVTHHMGGMVPYFEGRITPGLDVIGQRTVGEEYKPIKGRPIEYFKKFFADTALFGAAAATRCGYEFFGNQQILFASDCPFDPEGGSLFIRETMRVIDSLGLGRTDLRNVYEDNARKILKL